MSHLSYFIKRILDDSNRINRSTRPLASDSGLLDCMAPAASPSPSAFNLPRIPDITQAIAEVHPPPELVSSICERYDRHANVLRKYVSQSIDKTYNYLAHTPGGCPSYKLARIVRSFSNEYNTRLELFLKTAVSGARIHEQRYLRKNISFNDVSRAVFVYCFARLICLENFLPVLEEFFLRVPYPSASEHQILARAANMTVRQIAVWVSSLALVLPLGLKR